MLTKTNQLSLVISILIFSFFILNGCKDDDSPTDPNGNPAQGITINGHVKDLDGEPISGVSVIVKGKSAVITDAGGAFTVPGVTTPYEIRLILSTQQTAMIYQGLTRSDPTLLYLNSTTTEKSARISGTVPAAAGKTTRVFFVSGSKAWSTTADVGGAYSFDLYWKGSSNSYSGKLQVLRWTSNPNGLPVQYDAFGSKDLTISNGGTFSAKNFTTNDLTDPAEQNISGSIVRPTSGYNILTKTINLNFGNAVIYLAAEFGGALTDDFSYTVPSISGATFEVDAYATLSATPNTRSCSYSKKGVSGGATGVTINLTNAPQLNLPAHNGTSVDTTTQFLWAQGSGTGVNLVYIRPTVQGPKYYLILSGNSTYIPNLSPLGLGLPLNKDYEWNVTQIIPLSSVDDAASDTFVPLINGAGGDNGHGGSETFRFTTHQ
jgi:hypothetical protein